MPIFQSVNKILMGSHHFSEMFENSKNVLIVCDPFFEKSNAICYVTDKLKDMGITYTVFKDVKPDPGMKLLAEGLAVIQEVKPDVIVAFGGGSAIDAGKAMIFFAKKQKMIEKCSFIAIPTTSGTGSEVTKFAVITDEETNQKYPLIDDDLLPDYAVLDAQLTLTVPPAITADTGMDALTHAIEALVSLDANDFTDAVAEKAIRLIQEHFYIAYNEPDNLKSRQAMHNASCLAGIAFSNAGLGLNHGMAHALGARFHIPHGRANAVILPYVITFNGDTHSQRYKKVVTLFNADSACMKQSLLSMLRIVKGYSKKMHIPETLQDLGIAENEFLEALPEMAKAAVNDSCTLTNPRKCTNEEVEKVFLHAFYGKICTR